MSSLTHFHSNQGNGHKGLPWTTHKQCIVHRSIHSLVVRKSPAPESCSKQWINTFCLVADQVPFKMLLWAWEVQKVGDWKRSKKSLNGWQNVGVIPSPHSLTCKMETAVWKKDIRYLFSASSHSLDKSLAENLRGLMPLPWARQIASWIGLAALEQHSGLFVSEVEDWI